MCIDISLKYVKIKDGKVELQLILCKSEEMYLA